MARPTPKQCVLAHILAVCLVASGATMAAGAQAQLSVQSPIALDVVDGAIPVSLSGMPGSAAAGREVFLNRTQGNCLACHAVSALKDQPFPGEIGPRLDEIATQLTIPQLRLVVANAKLMFPETIMPAFYRNTGLNRVNPQFAGKTILSAQQVEDVVAFLATLK